MWAFEIDLNVGLMVGKISPARSSVDEKGRIILPKAIGTDLGLSEGSEVVVRLEKGRIVVSRAVDPDRFICDMQGFVNDNSLPFFFHKLRDDSPREQRENPRTRLVCGHKGIQRTLLVNAFLNCAYCLGFSGEARIRVAKDRQVAAPSQATAWHIWETCRQ